MEYSHPPPLKVYFRSNYEECLLRNNPWSTVASLSCSDNARATHNVIGASTDFSNSWNDTLRFGKKTHSVWGVKWRAAVWRWWRYFHSKLFARSSFFAWTSISFSLSLSRSGFSKVDCLEMARGLALLYLHLIASLYSDMNSFFPSFFFFTNEKKEW